MANERLRPARNEDGDAIRSLVFSVLREYALEPDPVGVDADLTDVLVSYVAGGGRFDVLVDEAGSIVGSVGIYPRENRTCELRKMYLAAPFRGRGLGRRLLEHALVEARKLGFLRMELETHTVLKEAVALYRQYGFQPDAEGRVCSRCNQSYFLDLEMPGDAPSRTD